MGIPGQSVNYNLASPFLYHSLASPTSLALSADGGELSYAELAALARKIAGWLFACSCGKVGRVGILASRTLEACAGVLGACWAGGTYIPFSLKVPEERLLNMLNLARLDAIITDRNGAKLLSSKVLAASPSCILLPDSVRREGPLALDPRVDVFGALPEIGSGLEPVFVGPEHIAYIIFTSGTTGIPKGVMIAARSVQHYLSVIQERFQFIAEDRISQASDLSFDASVTTMFMCWGVGASLHVVPESQAIAPVKFIQDHKLTVWWSVPSIVAFLRRLKAVEPGTFSTLRYSMFGGEPLPLGAALAWQRAAPGSALENSYGPTEVTIACIHQRLTDPPVATPERDTLSIGTPLPGTEAAIVDASFRFLPPGQRGELVLAGAQLAVGYLGEPEQTAARFPVVDGKRWYRTGDLAYQDDQGRFHHLGRIDNQVKILGNRVELEDIEAHLQKVCGSELVAAVAWPVSDGSATGVVAFVAGTPMSPSEIREALKQQLPTYMVPNAIHIIPTLPLTAVGKVNRKALVEMLERDSSGDRSKRQSKGINPL